MSGARQKRALPPRYAATATGSPERAWAPAREAPHSWAKRFSRSGPMVSGRAMPGLALSVAEATLLWWWFQHLPGAVLAGSGTIVLSWPAHLFLPTVLVAVSGLVLGQSLASVRGTAAPSRGVAGHGSSGDRAGGLTRAG